MGLAQGKNACHTSARNPQGPREAGLVVLICNPSNLMAGWKLETGGSLKVCGELTQLETR